MINGSAVGRGEPTDTPNVIHVIQLANITGSTGRFQGATGGFKLDYLQDDTNLPIALSSGSLTAAISTPGSTK